ncbi:MAG: flagellar motor switch protein FliN, partial [Verrucomicrobia bacterium]|nr:flagellar motor switch protein FliN [Verrucomicrobiota bacterium]
ASDPVGLFVNDKLVAYGEVVVVEDNFGIKITELVGTAPP